MATEQRLRGIFPVTVYTSQHRSTGSFVWADIVPRTPGARITLGRPMLLMGVGDARGLLGAPKLRLADQQLEMTRAPAGAPLPLATAIDPALLRHGVTLELDLQFELAGTGRIGWVPLADDNEVTLVSPWPHPSFGGNFLPRTRSVGAEGFEAHWRVSALSTQAQAQFAAAGDARPALETFRSRWPIRWTPTALAERAASTACSSSCSPLPPSS